MALKRKRSTGNLQPTPLEPTNNPLPFFYTQSKPTPPEALYPKSTWSFPTYSSAPSSPDTSNNGSAEDLSSKLNSRTRKRHRDLRPSEDKIYGTFIPSTCRGRWLDSFVFVGMSGLADVCRSAATTISKLYEAQRLHPNAEPVYSTSEPAHEEAHQKSTLHAFWNIGPQPMSMDTASSTNSSSSNLSVVLRCEDCDGSLRHADFMDVDMSDGMVQQESACAGCARQVCDRCAVMGLNRVCLPCATSRR
jgi:hypothetical protein